MQKKGQEFGTSVTVQSGNDIDTSQYPSSTGKNNLHYRVVTKKDLSGKEGSSLSGTGEVQRKTSQTANLVNMVN